MIQEKIKQVIALFAAGDPSFMAAFRAIESQLSTAEHWQLLRAISGELDESIGLAQQNRAVSQVR